MTDRWNDPKFQSKFASKFISYAIHHNIVFIFLLVIPAGMSVIPFLPLDRDYLKKIGETMSEEEEDDSLKNQLAKIVNCEVIDLNINWDLECNYIELNGLESKIYCDGIFDFRNNALINHVNGKSYKLTTKKGKDFVKALIEFIKLPDEQIVAVKNPTNIFKIYGCNLSKTIQWNETNQVLYASLERAIKEFLKL